MTDNSILNMVGGEKHINPRYNIKEEKEGLNEQLYNGSVLEERLRLTNQIFTLKEENTELKAQIEKMKQDLDSAREDANRQEQWEIYSVLNDIYNDNFEVITSISN